jgi:hypothetical protein
MHDVHRPEVPLMPEQHTHNPRERHDAEATTVSDASRERGLEADKRVPGSARETLEKGATEASAGDDAVDAVKRVGRELDRTFSGEYEAREDEAAAGRAERDAGERRPS